ncbi:MAG: DUF937 domain-containing protein [Saprospiraceae bacterium]|nr:DUF937 domain-containing protein [Saprospiraceae bacterium]
MDILQMLQGQLGEGMIEQLAGQIGADKDQTAAAANGVFSALLSGINKNVADPQGAQSFMSALERDHDGSILDNIGDIIMGGASAPSTPTTNGAGILNHVLGNNQGGIADAIGKMSGMDSGKVTQLLITLAPMVLGMLGKMRNNEQVNSGGGLIDLIGKTVQGSTEQQSSGSIFTRLLDRDGDGSVMDDLLQMGSQSLLGGLFKK